MQVSLTSCSYCSRLEELGKLPRLASMVKSAKQQLQLELEDTSHQSAGLLHDRNVSAVYRLLHALMFTKT